MMFDWLFRRPKPDASVQEATKERDALFDEFEVAMQEVDRVHKRVLDDYREAEEQRRARRRR